MTSPLRRKRPTTAPGRSTPTRTAAELLALGALLLAGGAAPAQQVPSRAPVAVTLPPPDAAPRPVAQTPAAAWPQAVPATDPVRQAALQQPGGAPGGRAPAVDEPIPEQTVALEPPGYDRIFGRRDSEDQLKERIRQEKRTAGRFADRIGFPEEPVLSRNPYYGRRWAPETLTVEPYYLCYNRLLFQQINMERYGWDLGPLSTIISPALFAKDFVLLPYHLGTDPFRKCECNTGYCLPGDPVPLLLYPPELSLTGFVAEAGTIVSLIAIFP